MTVPSYTLASLTGPSEWDLVVQEGGNTMLMYALSELVGAAKALVAERPND
jgi:hypothetical protein